MRFLRFGMRKATEADKRRWRKMLEVRRGVGMLTMGASRQDAAWILNGWDDALPVDFGIKPRDSLVGRNDANDIK